MLGLSGSGSVVAIQLGYCVADIISKCGVGFLIYNVCPAAGSLPTLASLACAHVDAAYKSYLLADHHCQVRIAERRPSLTCRTVWHRRSPLLSP